MKTDIEWWKIPDIDLERYANHPHPDLAERAKEELETRRGRSMHPSQRARSLLKECQREGGEK